LRPTLNMGDQAPVFGPLSDRVAQLYPQALGGLRRRYSNPPNAGE
jgi:hypothetical protein